MEYSIMVKRISFFLPGVFLLFSVFFMWPVSPAPAQILDHFSLDSSEYEALDTLYIRKGKIPPFYSRPFSNYQYLEKLREMRNTGTAFTGVYRDTADALLEKLENLEANEKFIKPILITNLRLQYRNEELSDFDSYIYYRDSLENPPLLDAGFKAGVPYVIARMEFDIRRDFFTGFQPGFNTNLPVGDPWIEEIDYTFPTKGYMKIGGKYADLLIGRDRLRWGPGYRGSLLLADSPPYYDMINGSLTLRNFKYSIMYASLESYLTGGEYAFQEEASTVGTINFYKPSSDQYKTLAGHRIEFSLFDRASFGIAELMVVGGRVPELSEMTPMTFFHNGYGENYMNVNVSFDAAAVPVRNLMVYGEFFIEDIRGAWEKNLAPPTSLGGMTGFRYVHEAGPGLLDFHFEWVRLDPWVYNRWQPYCIFTARKKFMSAASGQNTFLDFPVGYFLGPDVDSLFFEAAWKIYNRISASLSYEFRRKGRIYLDFMDPDSNFIELMNEGYTTPSGIPVLSHIFTLKGMYRFTPYLSASLGLSGGHRKNRLHQEGDNGYFFETTFNFSAEGAGKFF